MDTLHLPLKKKWFKMTKEEIKPEDYREVTPYWCARLLTATNGDRIPQKTWKRGFDKYKKKGFKSNASALEEFLALGLVKFKQFNTNLVTLGYPKKTDTDKRVKLHHLSIELDEGLEQWGAERGKIYFVIKHGQIV